MKNMTKKKKKKDHREIDDAVARMLKEDMIVGRWVRAEFPDRFEAMLKRAKTDSKRRIAAERQRQNVIIEGQKRGGW